MSDKEKKPEPCKNDSSKGVQGMALGAGIGVAVGAGIGAALGVAFDSFSSGVAVGAGVGVAIGPAVGMLVMRNRRK